MEREKAWKFIAGTKERKKKHGEVYGDPLVIMNSWSTCLESCFAVARKTGWQVGSPSRDRAQGASAS
jgi:hypothetical protein